MLMRKRQNGGFSAVEIPLILALLTGLSLLAAETIRNLGAINQSSDALLRDLQRMEECTKHTIVEACAHSIRIVN